MAEIIVSCLWKRHDLIANLFTFVSIIQALGSTSIMLLSCLLLLLN